MNTPQIAITTNEISQDFVTAVELGTSWGIRHFELKRVLNSRVPDVDEGYVKRMQDELKRFDADVVSVSPGLFLGVEVGTEKAREQAGDLVDRSIPFAELFDVRILVCFGFARPEGVGRDEPAPQEVIDVLGGVAARVAAAGMTVVIENDPNSWTNTGDNIADVLHRVGATNLGLNWDPGNYATMGLDPFPDAYGQVADSVMHLHVKDVVAIGAQDPMGHHWRTVGEGAIDWAGQIRALAQADYQGYLVIETHHGPFVAKSHQNCVELKEMISEATQ